MPTDAALPPAGGAETASTPDPAQSVTLQCDPDEFAQVRL